MRLVDERADVGIRLGAAAHLERRHALRETLRELLCDRLGDVEAIRGCAGLADVSHLRDHRALDRRLEVGVLEDDEGRIATELHRDAEHLLGALFDQLAPDLGRAREGELAGA